MTPRLVAILVLSFAAAAQAQDLSAVALAKGDWPEFRGPGAQGHSAERGLPLEWSETQNIAWKAAMPGLGWSSPVVANGRVWLTTAVEQRGISLRAIAFDAATGKEVVNVEVFKIPDGSPRHQSEEQLGVADAGRRRRSHLRALRRRRHRGAVVRPARSSGRTASSTSRSMAPADRRSSTATC